MMLAFAWCDEEAHNLFCSFQVSGQAESLMHLMVKLEQKLKSFVDKTGL